jgi:transposase-like protein
VPDLPGGPSEAHPYHQWFGEVQSQELKRRTRVVRIFPNRGSCLRLVSALAIEQSEEWLTGRRYLDMSELAERCYEERAEEGVIFMDR